MLVQQEKSKYFKINIYANDFKLCLTKTRMFKTCAAPTQPKIQKPNKDRMSETNVAPVYGIMIKNKNTKFEIICRPIHFTIYIYIYIYTHTQRADSAV